LEKKPTAFLGKLDIPEKKKKGGGKEAKEIDVKEKQEEEGCLKSISTTKRQRWGRGEKRHGWVEKMRRGNGKVSSSKQPIPLSKKKKKKKKKKKNT